MNNSEESKEIPIFLCFDANYAYYAAVATYSAHANTKSALKFFWIVTRDGEAIARKLEFHLRDSKVEISVIVANLDRVGDWKTGHHFTSATYLRLLAPDLLSSLNKAIYIDCDTLVLTDISELFHLDLPGGQIAGVVSPVGDATSRVPRARSDPYINTGVLLLDLDHLRQNDFLGKITAIYLKYSNEVTWADQCLINKYAEGNKLLIDSRWNREIFSNEITEQEFSALCKPHVSSILHFLGGTKPWHAWCNPLIAAYWWDVARGLQLKELNPTPISNIQQLMFLADNLHRNRRFEASSAVRGRVIQLLHARRDGTLNR